MGMKMGVTVSGPGADTKNPNTSVSLDSVRYSEEALNKATTAEGAVTFWIDDLYNNIIAHSPDGWSFEITVYRPDFKKIEGVFTYDEARREIVKLATEKAMVDITIDSMIVRK